LNQKWVTNKILTRYSSYHQKLWNQN